MARDPRLPAPVLEASLAVAGSWEAVLEARRRLIGALPLAAADPFVARLLEDLLADLDTVTGHHAALAGRITRREVAATA